MAAKNIRVAGMIEFPIYRMGLAGVLNKMPGIEFIGNTNMGNVIFFLRDSPSDVLLVNIRKKSTFNKHLFLSLQDSFPDLKVVIFLNSAVKEEISQYKGLEISGFLLKSIDIRELDYAIKTVFRSGFYYSQGIPEELITYFSEPEINGSLQESLQQLTKRERQIMMLIYHEYSTSEIADKLQISRRTVEAHRINIMRKIGVKSSIGIAKFVAHSKWIS